MLCDWNCLVETDGRGDDLDLNRIRGAIVMLGVSTLVRVRAETGEEYYFHCPNVDPPRTLGGVSEGRI